MIRTSFNDGWQVRETVSPFAEILGAPRPFQQVTLPHDAMLARERTAPDGEGSEPARAIAFFPDGAYEYRKTFFVPAQLRGKRVVLEFEGVYRDAMVYVNGNYAGQHPYGYSQFFIDAGPYLKFGEDNEVRVEARSHQDSRWYSGAGIYRDTWLLVGEPVHIEPESLRVTVKDIEPELAVTEVAVTIANYSMTAAAVNMATEILDAKGAVAAADTTRVTVLPGDPAVARQRLYVRGPVPWSPDAPYLYSCQVRLSDADGEMDASEVRFGVRRLQLDPDRGLRINGETVKLRGACVHHDNGPLGAATFARAEERRVQLLKEAGFNAIRMAHHPMSKAMLDACDRHGMLVMDEAFDMWTQAKSPFDYALSFPEWWERDIEAMVAKDHNHPSVILYSIGNEIPEVATASGGVWGRRLAEKIRSLDPARYITNGINNVLAVWNERESILEETEQEFGPDTGINTLMTDVAEAMTKLTASKLVTRRTTEAYSLLDIAGMNYSEGRYSGDRELFPSRVILGTETFGPRIDSLWRLVTQHSHVIGDFTWTGWDYLGEAGLGRGQYATAGTAEPTVAARYPYLVGDCGDIDITGHRRPISYYREIVFGSRPRPYIAVRPPEHHGKTWTGSPWAWSDAISSWTWPGSEGREVTVEVYSDADCVELLVNGRSLGQHPVGQDHRCRTEFETSYEPGELVAVAYRAGTESGRSLLRSAAGPVLLRADSDRPVIGARGGDLGYVTLTLTDANGTLYTSADRPVRLEISGPGVLQGFGSAAPSTEERFDAQERRTYHGRALAIIRPISTGEIRVRACAPECARRKS